MAIHGRAAGDRIESALSSLWLPRSVIIASTFIGPGWLPEQLGSLHKAGSTKMTQTYHNDGWNRYVQSQA